MIYLVWFDVICLVVERHVLPRVQVQPVIVMPAPAATAPMTTTTALVQPSPAPAVVPAQQPLAVPVVAPAGVLQRRAAVFTAVHGPPVNYETQVTSAVAAAPQTGGGGVGWAPVTGGAMTSAWQGTAGLQAAPAGGQMGAMGMATYSGGATGGSEYQVAYTRLIISNTDNDNLDYKIGLNYITPLCQKLQRR